jgi:hypothetical protein
VGLSRVLPLAINRPRRRRARRCDRGSAPPCVLGRVEEVRAALGFCDPGETSRDDAARPRDDPQRVWPPRIRDHHWDVPHRVWPPRG